jgi:amidase
VRIPASFCGLYGIRPTLRRVDLTGAMPMAKSFDVGGWFANSAGVLRKVGGVLLEGKAIVSKGGRDRISALYLVDNLFEQADAPVAALCREFLARAAPALPRQLTSKLAPANLEKWRDAFRIVQARETWESDGAFITRAKPKLGPGIKERMAVAAKITVAQADSARAITLDAREHIRASLEGNRVYALPTAPGIAPRINASDKELDAFRTRVQRLTCIAGLAGCPQVTIPIGTVDGCPAGLSLLGWPGSDEILLGLAVRLARYCGIAR